jgi:DNA repair protein RAD5
MVDCPSPLVVGVEMIVSLNVYLKASAFTTPSTSRSRPAPSKATSHWNEGEETRHEQMLRGRKAALNRLFKVLGLSPEVAGKPFDKQSSQQLRQSMVDPKGEKDGGKKPTKPRTEIVGDGEEVEIDEDDGEVTENQLELIYKK